ncbi:hypothetical protein B9Y25_05980 [Acinetobacter baumannii]|uniref:hypothetical protein n=1 Tax=Acinetobacter baumannii TaxID=470 RepID=UPI0002BC382F|nr:hypothetical protein [Acinetobacter baumannii]EKY1148632.1 hypothetical protein [Acinetobacter baumannii]ETQ78874.1 hypothetical protein P667_3242 [Acinetobacter baumannii UH5107]OTL66387.1 hypothetical protein B9Y25_05980 [Acinetobacter baumannii]RSP26395.1 hypothetical protein EA735_10350 [Acinetobacter baumannii]RTY06525.1 hypothetical protein EKS29_16910 [Acinetobacter baumannii]
MILPLINTFQEPYIVWHEREPTLEEQLERINSGNFHPLDTVKMGVKAEILTPIDAAQYMAMEGTDNRLERLIDDILHSSVECKIWQNLMPSITPEPLIHYKQYYPKFDTALVDNCIKQIGVLPAVGQHLFRGGFWPDGLTTVVTDQPLSTSFCPQVALRNAEWKGKAYDEGKIDIFVIRVVDPKTNIYFYNLNEILGNEKEVLFASGATLRLISRKLIRDDFLVNKGIGVCEIVSKKVPIYVLEIEIS